MKPQPGAVRGSVPQCFLSPDYGAEFCLSLTSSLIFEALTTAFCQPKVCDWKHDIQRLCGQGNPLGRGDISDEPMSGWRARYMSPEMEVLCG